MLARIRGAAESAREVRGARDGLSSEPIYS